MGHSAACVHCGEVSNLPLAPVKGGVDRLLLVTCSISVSWVGAAGVGVVAQAHSRGMTRPAATPFRQHHTSRLNRG